MGPGRRKKFTVLKGISFNGEICGAQLHRAESVGRLQEKEKKFEVPMAKPQKCFWFSIHDLIWKILKLAGVPSWFLSLCREIYAGSVQHIHCSADEYTDDIPLRVGIKQGCPHFCSILHWKEFSPTWIHLVMATNSAMEPQ